MGKTNFIAKKSLLPMSLAFLLVSSAYFATASPPAKNSNTHEPPKKNFETLDAISFGKQTVVFKLSGTTAKFNVFKISNPLRLVLDFTGVEHNLKSKETLLPSDVKNEIVARVRTGQFQNEPIKIARAVIELKKDVDYEVRTLSNGKEVEVSFKEKTESAKAAPDSLANTSNAAVPTPATSTTSQDAPKPIEVIAVPIEDEKPATTARKSGVSSSPNLKKVAAPTQPAVSQQSPAPPPKAIKSEPPKPAAKKEEKPVAKKEEQRFIKTTLPKTLVSFDFQDADIRDVLRVLSTQSGVNIIYGSDVAGSVTITLKNVPFDQAFATILTLTNLVQQDLGSNIIRVMTPQVLAQERNQAITFTKIFPLNYAKAEDVKAQLDAMRLAEGRRGIISVDSRTNTLIITDTQEGLDGTARIIQEIDKKPYQVLIEAKIVEVTLDKKVDLGINWTYARSNVSDGELQYIGKTQATVGGESDVYYGMPAGATRIGETGPTAGGTGVNFPATATQGMLAGISFGVISDNVRLNAMLSMLATKGLTKLLSNPRVTTLNNQEAKILVGERFPYVQQTTQLGTGAGGVTSEIQWLELGIKLLVTPTINADKQITLKVYPQVSLLSRVTPAGPVVGTREAQTTVMIKDNETVVIGGLIREEDIKSAAQVPLLGDIPIIGQLFKRKYDTKERTELLVFITPQIIASDD